MQVMNSIEKIWARATGHLMGESDHDRPDVPILTLREARIALFFKTFWVVIHVVTCGFIIAGVIRHWNN
jgi:hypothetical protein